MGSRMSMRNVVSAAIVMLVLCAPAAANAGPAGHAAAKCSISGKERKLGTTYVTSLTATGVSCSKAETFVKAFHKCRHRKGAAGRCASVSGYKCREKREAISTQYDSRATCASGSRKITQIYTQNT
jgi:hypothetical protein